MIELGKTTEYWDMELGAIKYTWHQIVSPVIINDQQAIFVELVEGK